MPQDVTAAPVHPELSGYRATVPVDVLARRLAMVVASWMSDEHRESYRQAIEQTLRAHESWHAIRDRRIGTCPTPATADRETAMGVPAAVDPVAVAIADASYVLRWLLQMRDAGMLIPTNIVELAARAVSVFPG